jgi:hypothetical protein
MFNTFLYFQAFVLKPLGLLCQTYFLELFLNEGMYWKFFQNEGMYWKLFQNEGCIRNSY